MEEADDDERMQADDRALLLDGDKPLRKEECQTLTYEEALKDAGYGPFHLILMVLCGWAVSSDAIEVLSISFILPSVECDMHLTSSDKGWLNAIIFIGMLIGGYFWGSLADHMGRRFVLLGSLTINGLGGLVSSTAQVFWLFMLMRLISGIGVGGSIPVIFSYFTEFQPKDKRGTMISVLSTFWMFGNIIAAGFSWLIIPQKSIGYFSSDFTFNSWRIFLTICTIPSLTSAAAFVLMPETPKFLLQAGRTDEAVEVMKRIYRSNNRNLSKLEESSLVLIARDDIKAGVKPKRGGRKESLFTRWKTDMRTILSSSKMLFMKPFRKISILMLVINFTLAFGYYGLWMWFPELFNRMELYGGSPCSVAAAGSNQTTTHNSTSCKKIDNSIYFDGFMTSLSNLPGNIFSIFLMDRIGRKILLAVSMGLSGFAVIFIWLISNKLHDLIISCVFGAVSVVGWNALNVLSAELFPTNIRSTAFGIQTAIVRVGAILGNIVFGELIDVHCAIPMLMVMGFLMTGGFVSLWLPNTTGIDIH